MYSKYFLVILSFVAASVFARPSDVPPEKLQPTVIPIISQSDELDPNGTYKFSYETGNGIKREETAYEKVLPRARDASSNEGGENDYDSDEIHVQQGSFSYTAPDGTLITLRYIADENGFQPIGDHLPRSPVIPSALSSSAEKSDRVSKALDSVDSASTPIQAKIAQKPADDAPAVNTGKSIQAPKTQDHISVTETAEEVKSSPISSSPSSEAEVPVEAESENISSTGSDKTSSIGNIESATTELGALEATETKSTPVPTSDEDKATTGEATLSTTESDALLETDGTKSTPVSVVEEEDKTPSTENVQSPTESVATSATTSNVDVSTDTASTATPAQSSTELEQVSIASAEQASTSVPEQSVSAEVTEPSSSTTAPEQTSSSEALGQSTTEDALNKSSAEEAEQPSTNASQPASPEESSSTTISA